MKVIFKESFEKDLHAIGDQRVLRQIQKLIIKLENAAALSQLSNIKKLAGGKNLYRIRLGDYRLGVIAESNSVTVVRILHRREIYRYFP